MHLVSATDHQRFQAVILPAQARRLLSFFDQQLKEIIIDRLVAIAKPFPEDQEPSIGQLRWHLFEHESEHKKEATAYAARSFLPLVQIPPDGIWGAGTRASYTTAERWLGKADASNFPALIHRYLAAFGPASVIDFQTWVGMTNQKAQLVSTVAGLVAYRSETGQVLYDLPDQPILNAETKAPVRFLPEYDNILIAHKDRSRILPEPHRKKVFLSAGRVAGTEVMDGFVAATLKVRKNKNSATLLVSPFETQSDNARVAIEAEGQGLIRVIEDSATEH